MDPCFWRETEADRVTRVVVFPRRADLCLHWSFSGNLPELAAVGGSGPGRGGTQALSSSCLSGSVVIPSPF